MASSLEQLALRAKRDPEAFEQLLEELEGLIRSLVNRYFLPSGTRDDLRQEALIGVWKAVRDYKPGVASFPNFARLCVDRQLVTAVKVATRGKHTPLNTALSFDHKPQDARDGATLEETLEGGIDPCEAVMIRERLGEAIDALRGLTEIERQAVLLVGQGYSYERVCGELGASAKRVDNAVQRARRKLGIAIDAVVRCDICDAEIAIGTRCASCEDALDFGRAFLARAA